MATVGQQLLAPETGWRRYNDIESRILYKGTGWTKKTDANYYEGNSSATTIINDSITFKFYGTKLRILDAIFTNRDNRVIINIDGIDYNYNAYNSAVIYQVLVFEKLDLDLGIHTVIIKKITNDSTYVILDAIDIDSAGYLLHPTLNQVSDINTMAIGDVIPCRYTATTSGQAGYFSELGTCTAAEIPIIGTATPDGLFYFIKVDKGTLIADRVIQTNISWDVLSVAKYIEGYTPAFKIPIVLTSNNSPSPYVVKASSFNPNYFLPWEAFNGAYDGGWQTLASGNPTGWIIFDHGITTPIMGYRIIGSTNIDGSPNTRAPKSWTFEGSNTGQFNGEQVILDTRTTETGWTPGLVRTYLLNGLTSFRYYRLNITANNGSSAAVNIGELEFIKPSIIRSLSGGCAYADANGNSSTTDKGLGAWPTNNEWDKYIVNSDLKGKITKGDDTIWHWKKTLIYGSWCKETWSSTIFSNINRILRGSTTSGVPTLVGLNNEYSNFVHPYCGFRPVLNYVESDIASEVIY